MGERKEKKRKRGGCGSDQGLYKTRVVCVWNGGTEWECRGKERMKLIIKGKKRRRKSILLVYATDLPARMQGFWVLVIANVYGHMRITGQQMWVQRGLVRR